MPYYNNLSFEVELQREEDYAANRMILTHTLVMVKALGANPVYYHVRQLIDLDSWSRHEEHLVRRAQECAIAEFLPLLTAHFASPDVTASMHISSGITGTWSADSGCAIINTGGA